MEEIYRHRRASETKCPIDHHLHRTFLDHSSRLNYLTIYFHYILMAHQRDQDKGAVMPSEHLTLYTTKLPSLIIDVTSGLERDLAQTSPGEFETLTGPVSSHHPIYPIRGRNIVSITFLARYNLDSYKPSTHPSPLLHSNMRHTDSIERHCLPREL